MSLLSAQLRDMIDTWDKIHIWRRMLPDDV